MCYVHNAYIVDMFCNITLWQLSIFMFVFQDTVVYGVIAFLYLFGTSLVLSAVDYYQKLDGSVSQWTIEQLIVTVVRKQIVKIRQSYMY